MDSGQVRVQKTGRRKDVWTDAQTSCEIEHQLSKGQRPPLSFPGRTKIPNGYLSHECVGTAPLWGTYFSTHKVWGSILSTKNGVSRERKEGRKNSGSAATVSTPCPHHSLRVDSRGPGPDILFLPGSLSPEGSWKGCSEAQPLSCGLTHAGRSLTGMSHPRWVLGGAPVSRGQVSVC